MERSRASVKRASDGTALTVGTGCVDITPSMSLALSWWDTERRATIVHRPLECRSMAVSDGRRTVVIVTLDLLGLASSYTDRLRTDVATTLGVPDGSVLVCCSHTHSGPMTPGWWLPGIDRPDEAYLEELRHRVTEVAAVAADCAVPVRVSYGSGSCDLGVSRRLAWDNGRVGYPPRADPAGTVDREVGVLRFDTLDGRPVAVLFSYGCHPTVGGPGDWLGPDYPGAAREAIENSFPGATALFLLGNAGDVRSDYTNADGSFRWDTSPALVDEAGIRVAHVAVQAARQARQFEPVLGIGHATRRVYCADDSLARVCEFSAVSLGGVAIVSNPAETFSQIGIDVRAHSPVPLVFTSLTNGMLGYVPERSAYQFGGYEVDTSYRSFGLSAPVRPDTHTRFVEGMLEALADSRAHR
jgi:neutral ceramidase